MQTYVRLILVLFLGVTSSIDISAQKCGTKSFTDSCSVFPRDYIFTKARTIKINNRKDLQAAVFRVILTKGNTYVITTCEGDSNDGRMVVNLMDRNDKLIMSNHNIRTGKYYNKIIFNCNASGTYHLGYLFDGGDSKGCGVSAFGFKKR